jgi:putative tryptophan/tyrosine transport system substrate-binding protein
MMARLQALALVSLAACCCLFGLASTASAQQSGKVPLLGYISPGTVPRFDNAFLQGLQDQGYIVPGEIPHYDKAYWRDLLKRGYFSGQKIRIEVRATGEDFERAPQLAAELVSLNVDVIFAIPALLAQASQQAVQNANKSIPIVFGPEYDPVGSGLVDSLARPPRSMTGLAFTDPEFEAKRLQILKEAFPRISRVAYLTDPAWYPQYVKKSKSEMETAARALGVRLQTIEINTPKGLKDALAEITRARADAIIMSASPLFLTERQPIVDFAAKHRLPTMYPDAIFVEDGGLMFYGAPIAEWKRHAAAIVAKILKGANPADIPIEQPTTFKLIINLKTARALRLSIPNKVLFRADQVIE